MFWELYTTYFKIVVYYCFFPLGRISYRAVEVGCPHSSNNRILLSCGFSNIIIFKTKDQMFLSWNVLSLLPWPQPAAWQITGFLCACGFIGFFFSPSVLIASNTGMHRRQITDLLDQSIQVHSQCFVVTSDNRYILLCGFWDKSFRVYSTDTGNLIISLSVTSSLQQVAVRGLKGFLISPLKVTEF